MITLKNYNNYKEAYRFYGGNAGTKMCIIDNGHWMLKFPKNTKNLSNVGIPYTTSPISEYIGSKIYENLGFDTHKVELGRYNNKIVVACKDFNENGFRMIPIHDIKNYYLKNLEIERENISSSTTSRDQVDLNELLFVMENNKLLLDLNAWKLFFQMFVVDCFINNNDRHNWNWGVLINEETGEIKLAPIFDNGASFFSKHDDIKISKILNDEQNFKQILLNGKTPYVYNENRVDSVKALKNLSLDKSSDSKLNKGLINAVISVVPKINLESCCKIIDDIPEKFEELDVISSLQKEFYKKFLIERYKKILSPVYEKVLNK